MTLELPPRTDERADLLEALAHARTGIRNAARGLTEEQARSAPTVSRLSVGGIVKHLTVTEDGWVEIIAGSFDDHAYAASGGEPSTTFALGDDETIDDVVARYVEATSAIDGLVATFGDLSETVPVPESMRKYVASDTWSLRWILLQLLTETTRHAGHADIVRESIDGATAPSLTAAADPIAGSDTERSS
jgi:hypothetical protein